MDAATVALLTADINAQRLTVDRVFDLLQQRCQALSPENPEKLESVAYQIHNFYGAVEDLLKLVATYCENNIADASRWHSLLLRRMTQPIEGVRPSFLSLSTYDNLNQLRAFRHFFRHAYGVPLDFEQLRSNLERVLAVKPLLEQDCDRFLQHLRSPD
ncbi:MAG: hypothetical protein ACFB0C_01300 [Leptolyngbyaceae cyanobacterium]